MFIAYLLIFCRIVLGLLFFFAFLGKAPNLPPFERTISSLEILPERFSRLAPLLFLIGELAVILFLALDGPLLGPGFALAALLLLGLMLAHRQKIEMPAHKAGVMQKPRSDYDLWRNAGFIGCALVGSAALALNRSPVTLSLVEGVVIGLGAALFVVAWTQLGEIAQLLRVS